MDEYTSLLLMFGVTAVFLLFHENKSFWALLLMFWCLMLSIYEYFHSGSLLCGVWIFNAWLWFNSYKRHLKAKKEREENEKGDN